jgi:hypothetical protein
MDLIGPCTIQVRGNPYEYKALTATDTVINLVKIIRIDDKKSKTVARIFAQCWLTGYPWPRCWVHDLGTESHDQKSKRCHEIVTSEMCALLQKNHSLMLCVKECTKQ